MELFQAIDLVKDIRWKSVKR